MGGHALRHAIERAKLDPGEIDDVIMGCANPEGATGRNIARQIAIRAGCPVTTSGMTINRFCSSGLQTIAIASQRVMAGEGEVYAAGGVESISCVQNEMNKYMLNEEWILEHKPELYWPMLQTAEYVAQKYGISRQRQDEYGVCSQLRAAAARERGDVPVDDRSPAPTANALYRYFAGRSDDPRAAVRRGYPTYPKDSWVQMRCAIFVHSAASSSRFTILVMRPIS